MKPDPQFAGSNSQLNLSLSLETGGYRNQQFMSLEKPGKGEKQLCN